MAVLDRSKPILFTIDPLSTLCDIKPYKFALKMPKTRIKFDGTLVLLRPPL